MRYHELSNAEAPFPPFRPPNSRPCRSDGQIKLAIRLMPAVYRWRHVDVRQGEPQAEIGVDAARISHPKPYDLNGALTQDCRKWIIEAVHAAAERRGLSICIVFAAEDAIYCWPGGVLVASQRAPEGGLSI